MNAWKKISIDNFKAAEHLRDSGYPRASVNRAYYAVYSAVTMCIVAGGYKPGGDNPEHSRREGPPHGEVLRMKGIPVSIPEGKRDKMREQVGHLYKFRLWADYYSKKQIGLDKAGDSILIARYILKELGLR